MRSTGLALLLVLGVACGGSGADRVTGIIIAVDGDLEAVASFEVQTTGGDRLVFEPTPGLAFDEGGPLSHVISHMQAGVPVRVTY